MHSSTRDKFQAQRQDSTLVVVSVLDDKFVMYGLGLGLVLGLGLGLGVEAKGPAFSLPSWLAPRLLSSVLYLSE